MVDGIRSKCVRKFHLSEDMRRQRLDLTWRWSNERTEHVSNKLHFHWAIELSSNGHFLCCPCHLPFPSLLGLPSNLIICNHETSLFIHENIMMRRQWIAHSFTIHMERYFSGLHPNGSTEKSGKNVQFGILTLNGSREDCRKGRKIPLFPIVFDTDAKASHQPVILCSLCSILKSNVTMYATCRWWTRVV